MTKIIIHNPILTQYDAEFFQALDNHSRHDLRVCCDTTLSNYGLSSGNAQLIKTHRIRYLRSFGLYWSLGLIFVIVRNMPDTLVINANPRDLSIYIAILVAKILNISVVSHGMFHKTLFALSDKVAVYSTKGKDTLISIGCDEHFIHIVGTADQNKRSSLFKKEIRNIQNHLVINHIMRISSFKNTTALYEYFTFFEKHQINFTIRMIQAGDGLVEFCKHSKYQRYKGFIEWHDATYDQLKIEELYHDCHISLIPQCIGLTFFQSINLDTPVFSCNSEKYQASEYAELSKNFPSLVSLSDNHQSNAELILRYVQDAAFRDKVDFELKKAQRIDFFKRKVAAYERIVDIA